MASPDFAPMTLRRVAIMEDRLETLHLALHVTLIVIFVGLMIALYTVREDILKAVKGTNS
jgi:ABC-type Fe3+ transport system permease subunit